MDIYAIIVAGGKGTRMQMKLPKQYLKIDELPILMHTILKFDNFDATIKKIVVIPESDFTTWNNLCKEYGFRVPHEIVAGGSTRFQSVKNGLSAIGDSGIVIIHDGVRPLVNSEIIANCIENTITKGNAITSVPLKDSIRSIEGNNSKGENRSQFRNIQTPQTFTIEQIKKAYSVDELPSFTDDASVLENYGINVNLVDGAYSNIKITTTEDLVIAEMLIKEQKKTSK